eukprot:s1446_g11.t1
MKPDLTTDRFCAMWDDAIGLENFRPWSPQGAPSHPSPYPPYPAYPAPTRSPSEEEAPLRRLLRDCCVAMGKQEAEAQRFWTRLQAEWLESPQQMRLLSREGWQRLALPVGLEAELQRRLDGNLKDQKLKQLDLSTQRRRQSPGLRKAKTSVTQAGPSRPAATPVSSLRHVLRSHCGDAWAAQLLSQLRKEGVDANALQSALRSLGVPSYSQAAVSNVVRQAGRDTRGLPSAEDVVAAIHGLLTGARARMVDEVFFDLGGDIHGTLPRQMLKRRMATLELPAVKAGVSAEEALRSFTRHWGFRQEVDRETFSAAHVLLSVLHRGEDDAFNHLLRRLWRLPKTTGEDVRDCPVPRLVSKKTEGLNAGEGQESDRRPARANILEQERAPEDRSHRIANIEDAIQSSSRKKEVGLANLNTFQEESCTEFVVSLSMPESIKSILPQKNSFHSLKSHIRWLGENTCWPWVVNVVAAAAMLRLICFFHVFSVHIVHGLKFHLNVSAVSGVQVLSLNQAPQNATTVPQAANASKVTEEGSFGFDMTNVSLQKYEHYMWIVAASSLTFALIFELCHRRFAHIDLTLQPDYGAEHHEQKISQLFSGILPLARPFFLENRGAWGYISAIAMIGGINLVLWIILMVWQKELWDAQMISEWCASKDAIEKKNIDRFFPLLLDVAFLACGRIVLSTYSDYIGMMLSIRWRQYMTQWFDKSFYSLQLGNGKAPDNPDQRIQEDVRVFVEQSMLLGTGFTIAVSQLVSRLRGYQPHEAEERHTQLMEQMFAQLRSDYESRYMQVEQACMQRISQQHAEMMQHNEKMQTELSNYMLSRTVAEQEVLNLRKELIEAHAKFQNSANSIALETEQRHNQKVSQLQTQYEAKYAELRTNLEAGCRRIVDDTVKYTGWYGEVQK